MSKDSVEAVLEEVRPFLAMAGGSIELISLSTGGIAPTCTLRMVGTGAALTSVKVEIQQRLKRKLPDEQTRTEFLNTVWYESHRAGLDEGLVAPLTASEAITDAAQSGMETNARALRTLEMAARKIGNPAIYDTLLDKAAAIVGVAAGAGVLTPVRQARLIEILCGSDAAAAVYRSSG